MDEQHSLLKRQVKRYFGDPEAVPESWREFVEAVNAAYHAFDEDRAMLERSLDLSSQELLQSNSELRALFQAFPDIFFRLDTSGTILDYKGGSAADFYLPPEKLIGKRIQEIPLSGVGARFAERLRCVLESGRILSLEYPLTIGGRESHYEARLVPLPDAQVVVIIRNITERKRSEQERQASDQAIRRSLRFEQTISAVSARFVGVYDLDAAITASLADLGTLSGANRAYLFLLRDDGAAMDSSHEWCAEGVEGLRHHRQHVPSAWVPWWMARLRNREAIHIEDVSAMPEEARVAREFLEQQGVKALLVVPVEAKGEVVGFLGYDNVRTTGAWSDKDLALLRVVSGIIGNALERARAEEALRAKEEQLRHSQKMEAVGRMAGGVAHDFNNLLTVIAGHSDLLLRRLPPDSPMRRHVDQIRQSGERAASLTGQLLAFSRKQMLQPRVLDLNAVVAAIGPMLRRLIGEHIRLDTILSPRLGCVMADPGQIEQVIMNLAINARDAMLQGGRLTIATANRTVRTEAASRSAAVPPGDYVTLEVADTGVGMDADTQARCFEPFFTTKGPGKGTGLGLATVYGIIRQSGGYVELWSQPARGTAFTLYLPWLPPGTDRAAPGVAVLEPLKGTETILLVEDEQAVRELTREILLANGYRVLDAGTPSEALELETCHAGTIHLLVTDVVMPDLGGRALAERLVRRRPGLRVLYMSGYTDDEMFERGVSGADAVFLSKPFTFSVLARKVREVLDRPG